MKNRKTRRKNPGVEGRLNPGFGLEKSPGYPGFGVRSNPGCKPYREQTNSDQFRNAAAAVGQ